MSSGAGFSWDAGLTLDSVVSLDDAVVSLEVSFSGCCDEALSFLSVEVFLKDLRCSASLATSFNLK